MYACAPRIHAHPSSLVIAGGGLRLMYVTPERVAGSKRLMVKLEKLYAAGQLARVAVDEAHCVSQVRDGTCGPRHCWLGRLRRFRGPGAPRCQSTRDGPVAEGGTVVTRKINHDPVTMPPAP